MAEKAGVVPPKRQQDGGVNVQVLLRCRPVSTHELATHAPQVVQCHEGAREVTLYQNLGSKQLGRTFHFDRVFGQDAGQERLYEQSIFPIVEEVLEGFNCTIFAYGQTGTGKTYTMEGGDRASADGHGMSPEAGVIPRAIHQIFQHLDSIDSDYTVKCSFLELYNEETTDLLAVGDASSGAKLRMMEDRSGVVVQGLEELIVKTSTDIYNLLDRGSAKRKTAATLLNKGSSRSHSVFCVTVHMREMTPEGEEVIKIGKLYLVDLAGSENISRSGAVDVRAKEAGLINKSLLTLGRVITALVENSGHVPYRDSKLTRLLRDSLGGRTKTCIIATIAPTVQCLDETLSTLDYAHRAKNIRNRPEINQKVSKATHIKEMNSEIDRLKAELFATREKNGVYMPHDAFEMREADLKSLQMRVVELASEAESAQESAQRRYDALRLQLSAKQTELETTRGNLDATQAALDAARQAITERDYLIATHEQSEARLVAAAAGLRTELGVTATELAAVFAKVDQQAAQEAANAALIKELRSGSADKLQAMEAVIAAAVGAQRERWTQVSRLMSEHVARKEADLAALRQQSVELAAQLAAFTAEAASALDGAATASSSGFEGLQQLHGSFAADAVAKAASAAEALEAAHAAFCAHMAAQGQQLDAFVGQQRSAAQAALAATQAAVASATRGFEESGAAAAACRAAASATVSQQAEALAAFEERFSSQAAQEQASLVEQIGGMVAAFARHRTEAVSGAVDAMRRQLAEGGAATGGRFEELHRSDAAALAALQVEETAAVQSAEEASQVLEQHVAAALTASAACQSGGAQSKASAAATAEDAARRLAAHGQALAQAVAAATAQVATATEAGRGACETGARALRSAHDDVLLAADQSQTVDAATTSGILGAAAHASRAVQGFGEGATLHIASLAAHIEDRAGVQYVDHVPRGDLPPRRKIAVPPESVLESMRTPAPAQVLAKYRQQQEGGAVGTAPAAPSMARSSVDGASVAASQEDMEEAATPEEELGVDGKENALRESNRSSDGGPSPAKRKRGMDQGPAEMKGPTPSRIRGAFRVSRR